MNATEKQIIKQHSFTSTVFLLHNLTTTLLLISLVLFIQAVGKCYLLLWNRKILMLILCKMCATQKRMSCPFYSKIIIKCFGSNTPPDKIKEPWTFHSKFHPPFPLQSKERSCLIPCRNILTGL